MFAWALSSAIAFIVFGLIYNILRKIKPNWFDDFAQIHWILITICSLCWVVSIPIFFIIFISYLLKLLVDKISRVILKRVKK